MNYKLMMNLKKKLNVSLQNKIITIYKICPLKNFKMKFLIFNKNYKVNYKIKRN